MNHAKLALIVFTVGICAFALFAATRVGADVHAAPLTGDLSTEPTSTVLPASPETVRAALHKRGHAKLALREYKALAACFLRHPHLRLGERPDRNASDSVWTRAGLRWSRLHQRLDRSSARLTDKMLHPGGSSSGVRWMPLARHVGWPEYTLGQLASIIYRESSGRENARNPSGASGLLQLMPGWWTGQWGVPAGNPFDPEYNLRSGHLMWHKSGWSPWSLTAY
jgi:hypothetical protein